MVADAVGEEAEPGRFSRAGGTADAGEAPVSDLLLDAIEEGLE
jgi:hypothetical protein